MNYRKLGNSGLSISEISLGTWLTFDGSSQHVDKHDAIDSVRFAYEQGINYFDTANFYGLGEAEKVVGEALRPYPRSSYVIGSKVYFPMGEGPNDRGLSRKHIIEQCEGSLKRLGVDYIDLYMCHRYDRHTPLDETLWTLNDLVMQGKILYYGVSNWSAAQITEGVSLARTLGIRRMISNQPIYNMLVRQIEKDILPVSHELGIGQIVFSPLAQGVLAGLYDSPEDRPMHGRLTMQKQSASIKLYFTDEIFEIVRELKKLAKEAGMTMPQLALSWILLQPDVASVIMGADNRTMIAENIRAGDQVWDESLKVAVSKVLNRLSFTWPLFD